MQELDATSLRTGSHSLLLFGPPGTQKTRFALECPKPVWLYDFDFGALSVAREAKEGEIKIFRFAATSTGNRITEKQHRPKSSLAILEFIKHFNSIFDMKPEDRPRTVMIDSLTPFSDRCMEFALAMNKRDEPVFQDWGQAMSKIRETVEAGCSLPCNFILTAHEQTDRDEILGKVTTLPLTIGKLALEIGRFFDEVFYTSTEMVKKGQVEVPTPFFLTMPDGLVKVAKSRTAARPKKVEARWDALFPGEK